MRAEESEVKLSEVKLSEVVSTTKTDHRVVVGTIGTHCKALFLFYRETERDKPIITNKKRSCDHCYPWDPS